MAENKCVFLLQDVFSSFSVKFNVPYHMIETITQSKLYGIEENLVIAASALAATTKISADSFLRYVGYVGMSVYG